MKTILLLASLAFTTAAPLKGAQPRNNLRQRTLHKSKTAEPTLSPSFSPTLSPTECEKGCAKSGDKSSEDTDDTIIIEFDDAYTASPSPPPTFIDDFIDTPAPVPISDETGEPENGGIGITVDVGGNDNIVDVNVIITQNGDEVDVPGGDSDYSLDDAIDDFIDDGVDDGYGSMSMSMGTDDEADDTYADPATNDEAPEEMEKPEDVAEIEFDDDFSTFFNKKKEPTEKTDKV